MGAMTRAPGGVLTRADLAELPDDGLRYELIDGVLFVTPAPATRHQVISSRLVFVLMSAVPRELRVLTAPYAVVLADDTEVQPDLLVAPRDRFTDQELPGAPLLVVEILSPSTRRTDLQIKKERYQRAGVPSYWVIDPHEPRLTVWELDDGVGYRQVADVAGDETWTATAPFTVTVTPSTLLD